MSNATATLVGNSPQDRAISVYANIGASETIYEGMALCYDRTTGAVGPPSTLDRRNSYCVKPTISNYNDFAGVVAPGAKRTGPGDIQIIPFDGSIARGVNLLVDENISEGDLLGVIPGEYYLGRCVVGQPVAIATYSYTAISGTTTTPGNVACHFGPIATIMSPADIASKINRFFDHFTGERANSATAELAAYLMTGGSIAAFSDSLTQSDVSGATAVKSAWGNLGLTAPASTAEASITLNGEPFSLAAGRSLFFRARFAQSSIAAGVSAILGIGITDTDAVPLANRPSDVVAIETLAGAISVVYDSTAGSPITVTPSPAVTLVAATYKEVAILVRLKTASVLDLHIWIDGTEIASPTETAASIPNAESLTFIAAISDTASGQPVLNLDRVEINNYIG